MGDQDDGPALHLSGQAGTDLLIRSSVHRGKRIVEYHDRRLSHQHTGYGRPLDLAAGQGHAPFSDISLISVREALDCAVQGGHTRIFSDGVQFRPVFRNSDIIGYRAGKQIRFLQYRPDMPAQPFKSDMGYIMASYSNPALAFRQFIKPGQKPYKGRFAGSCTAKNTNCRSCGNGQGDMVQHLTAPITLSAIFRLPRILLTIKIIVLIPIGIFTLTPIGFFVRIPIGIFFLIPIGFFVRIPIGIFVLIPQFPDRIRKGNILKYNIPAHIRFFRVRAVFLRRRVHDLPDPVQRYRGLAHLRNGLGHHTDGPCQHGGIGSQRYVITGADPPFYAKVSSQDGHDHDLCGGDQITCCPEGGGYTGMIHVSLCIDIVLGREALPFVLFPAKGPDHPDPCQILLGDGGKLSLLHVCVLVRRSDLIMKISGIQENDRDKKRFRHSQRRRNTRDKIHGQNNQNRDPQQVDHLLRDKGLDHLHIRCTALDQVACPVPAVP